MTAFLYQRSSIIIIPKGFAPRTPLHALSLAATSARSDRVGSLARSFASDRVICEPARSERHRARRIPRRSPAVGYTGFRGANNGRARTAIRDSRLVISDLRISE